MNLRHHVSGILVVLAIFLAGRMALSEDLQDPPPKEKFHLFLLAGQSNMAGRGEIAEEDRKPHPRVLMLTQKNEWKPAIDPLHFDKPSIVGVGLGRAFAIRIAEANPDIAVGLIPCAVGGSSIASWEPRGYHAGTKIHPYDEALQRTAVALRSGVLKGILWHQGESDAMPAEAVVYEQKLHELIMRFRKEYHSPELPFLAGQMGQFADSPWDEAKNSVDMAHRELLQKIPHTAFVGSDGLSHKGDKVHFDARSYRELGRRYAEAYLILTGAAPSAK